MSLSSFNNTNDKKLDILAITKLTIKNFDKLAL